MAVNARFIADFASFQQAVTQAEVKLASFEQSGAKVEKSLTRMANSLNGTKLIQDATLMAAAIEKVGGVSALTAKELQKVGAQAAEAADKARRMGLDVPAGIQKIEEAAKKANTQTTSWLTGLGTQIASTAAGFVSAQAVINVFTGTYRTMVDFVASSVTAFADAEAAQKKMITALQQQGTATPQVIAQYNKLATQFQATTVFSDDLINKMQALLTQIGGVMPSQMQAALKASTDLAAGLGIDLEEATRLVAKAAAGHTETLGRYGITVSEAALKTKGFEAVLEAVNRQFGGQATAQLETYTGHIKQIENAWNNVQEAIGKIIVQNPFSEAALRAVTDHFKAADTASADASTSIAKLAETLNLPIDAPILGVIEDLIDDANQLATAYARLAAMPTPPIFAQPFKATPLASQLAGLPESEKAGLAMQDIRRSGDALTATQQKVAQSAFAAGKDVAQTIEILKEYWPEIDRSRQALEKLQTAFKEAEAAQKKFAEAEKNIAAALAGPGGLTVEQEIAIRQLHELGVSTSDIAQHLHVAEGAVNSYLKSWDELNQNIKESRDIGAEAAKVIGEAFKGPLNVIKDLAIAMGEVPIATRQMEQQVTQSIRLIEVAESGLAAQMRQGVGLMPDMSRQAAQHMQELRIGIDHTDDAMLALVDAVQKFGIASGNAFGGLLIALPEIIKLLHDAKLAAAEAAIHPEDVALANKAEMARKAAIYGGIALGAGIVAQSTAGATSTGGIVAHGAATGASIGASVAPYLGPYGPAAIGIGAGVGAIVGLIQSGKEWHKVMSDVARDFGGLMVPKDFADSIKELESQTGLGRVQALTTQLDQLVKIAGGLRSDNFDLFFGKLHDAFSMLERGELSLVQVSQILDKNFADFAAAGTDAYGRVSDKIKELIELNERFGTQSKAITDFLKQQASNAAGALGDLLTEPAIAAYDAIKKSVDEAQAAVDAAQGDAEKLAAAQQHLTDVLSMQFAESERAKTGLEDLGTAAVLAFNAAIASGDDFVTALNKISPSLDTIQRAFKDLGLDIDNTALKGLALENQILNGPGGTGKAIGGLNALFTAATNIPGLLTPADFAAQQRVALGLYSQTQAVTAAAGGGTINALLPFQQILHEAQDYAKKNQVALDPMVQILIDQSKELGIWSDDFKSDSEKTRQSIADLISSNTDLAKALGGVEGALKAWTGGGGTTIPTPVNPTPTTGGGGDDEAYRHSYGRGSGGIVDFGSGTRAILHDREIVLTEQQYQGILSQKFPAPPWMNDWNYRGGVIEPTPQNTYKPGPVDRKPMVISQPTASGPVYIDITVYPPAGTRLDDPEAMAGALNDAIREDRQFVRTNLERLARNAVTS